MLKIYTGARGSKFVCDDTRGFGDAIAAISVRAGAPIMSCAREERAEPLLRQIGKMSQKQLYACSLNCQPSCHGNCNPANPPGRSTHERRNDGVAYRNWGVGRWLPYWARGIDVQRDRVSAFIREAAKEKWLVSQTYPGSPSESQHVNFRRKPRISLWEFRPLKAGMSGPRVRAVIRHLKAIEDPDTREPYLPPRGTFNGTMRPRVVEAVKAFQRDHHIKPDGIVGLRTITALRGMARRPPVRMNRAGIEHLIDFEAEILHAYNDPAGHCTFGVGHLLHKGNCTTGDYNKYGSAAKPRDRDDMRKRSRALLESDLRRFERAVVREVPLRWRKSNDRFNALTSLAFNLGEEILTPGAPLQSVGQALRGRRASRVAEAILLFDKAGSPPRPLPGLTRRRRAEAKMFLRNR